MKKHISILLLISSLFFCFPSQSQVTTYQPYGLRKLTHAEMLDMVRSSTFPDNLVLAVYDTTGQRLTAEEVMALYNEPVYADHYVDENGLPRATVMRYKTVEDVAFTKKLLAVIDSLEAVSELGLIDVDCDKAAALLEAALDSDQAIRSKGVVIDKEIDLANQQVVFSIIEKCGFPDKTIHGQIAVDGAFLVLQHADYKAQVRYFPLIKASGEKGDLKQSTIALMEDRILMHEGKRQKYGTQVHSQGDGPMELYPVENVSQVNERRKSIGLGPIEDYLNRWNIEFDPAVLEQKWSTEGH